MYYFFKDHLFNNEERLRVLSASWFWRAVCKLLHWHVYIKHASCLTMVLLYCMRIPCSNCLVCFTISIYTQAMKVLSKKRLMRQAGFPRKCLPCGRWGALWGEGITVCVFILDLRHTFLLIQEDLLLEVPALVPRVHLSPKAPWSGCTRRSPSSRSWTILMWSS